MLTSIWFATIVLITLLVRDTTISSDVVSQFSAAGV